MNPDILVFDEAFSALDKGLEENLIETIIKDLAKIKTIIVVSHNINLQKVCEINYKLNNGTIVKKLNNLLNSEIEFMGKEIDLLYNYPKVNRDIKKRVEKNRRRQKNWKKIW